MKSVRFLLCLTVCLFMISAQVWCENGGTGNASFDWAGAYSLSPGDYVVSFRVSRGTRCPSSVKMVLMRTGLSGDVCIDESESKAMEVFHSNPVTAPGGKGIIIVPGETLYGLPLEAERARTEYRVRIGRDGVYLMFIETGGVRFMDDVGFVTDFNGHDVRPFREKRF